jgi:hypothetical protein
MNKFFYHLSDGFGTCLKLSKDGKLIIETGAPENPREGTVTASHFTKKGMKDFTQLYLEEFVYSKHDESGMQVIQSALRAIDKLEIE